MKWYKQLFSQVLPPDNSYKNEFLEHMFGHLNYQWPLLHSPHPGTQFCRQEDLKSGVVQYTLNICDSHGNIRCQHVEINSYLDIHCTQWFCSRNKSILFKLLLCYKCLINQNTVLMFPIGLLMIIDCISKSISDPALPYML